MNLGGVYFIMHIFGFINYSDQKNCSHIATVIN